MEQGRSDSSAIALKAAFSGLRKVQSAGALEKQPSSPNWGGTTLTKKSKRPSTSDAVDNPLISWRSYGNLETSAKTNNDEWTCSLLSRLQKRRPMSSSTSQFGALNHINRRLSWRLENHNHLNDGILSGRPDSVFNLIAWSSVEDLESNAKDFEDEFTSNLLSRMRERRQREDSQRSRIESIQAYSKDRNPEKPPQSASETEMSNQDDQEAKPFRFSSSKNSSMTVQTDFTSSSSRRQSLSKDSIQEKPVVKTPSQIEEDKQKWRRANESDAACVRRVSLELNCPMDTTQEARELFNRYADYDQDNIGYLEYETFGEILGQMMESTGQKLAEAEMQKKIKTSWYEADRDGNGQVDFQEFAIWYSSWGFQQQILLNPEQIQTRDLAKKFELSVAEVDAVRIKFDRFDEDGSGEIEFEEFEKLLYKLMKIPSGQELPASRVKHFWIECDLDGSGGISFEEFLQWYMKYFDVDGNTDASPVEQLYMSVRSSFARGG